jgi:hypothetical protein
MAKTNAERQARWRERMHEAGWKPLTVWVSQEALEVLARYPLKERGSVISQAVIGWKGNVTSDVTNNVTDNIHPVLEELMQRLEALERRVMGEMTENVPKIVTGNVIHNVTDNFTNLQSLAGTGEYKAALVKEAQRLHAEGRSFEAIAREWNAGRLPTLSQKGHWHGKTIQRLVQSALRPLQSGPEAR